MATNSVEVQLKKAIEMKDKVIQFAGDLVIKMQDLEAYLEQSVRAGFPEDIAKKYHEFYYVPDNNLIGTLSETMRKNHVDFLERVIENLTKARDQR